MKNLDASFVCTLLMGGCRRITELLAASRWESIMDEIAQRERQKVSQTQVEIYTKC